jgi:hypothetical protein
MKTMHLGVVENAYTYGSRPRSTGEVGEALEERYGIVHFFVETHFDDVADAFRKHMVAAFSSKVSGRVAQGDPAQRTLDHMRRAFEKDFILARALDGRPGVPTLAARLGIVHRYKYARGTPTAKMRRWRAMGMPGSWSVKDASGRYAKGYQHPLGKIGGRWAYRPERPSFFDTGLYARSFKVWFGP